MPTTRYSSNQDIAHAPERNLSDAAHRPINVSLAIIAQSCRIYSPRERAACLWLGNVAANSQRIQLSWQLRGLPDPLGTVGRITEADLAGLLDLDRQDIYAALTGHEKADMPRFVAAVEKFRAHFESQLPPLVRTEDTATIESAFRMAADEHRITTIQGKWRHGKTEECQRLWLKNLHRSIWVATPDDTSEISLYVAVARALGISTGAKKAHQMREQITRALGVGLIDVIWCEEAHFNWPKDVANARPVRIDYYRGLRDNYGVGSVNITTDQFALNLAIARKHNAQWAPGQLYGRQTIFELRDSHTDKEIAAIAKLHGNGLLPAESIPQFVAFARAEEGYLGAMVNAISVAQRTARAASREQASLADVAAALKQQRTDQRIDAMADVIRPRSKRRSAFELVKGRRAA